jgi:nucleoside phosphorylase
MQQADVVLVTVNEIETKLLKDTFEFAGYPERVQWGPVNTYGLFGSISGATIAHVRCTMGSGGQGGSTLTIIDAIRDLRPSSVIGVGVAFGIDETTQPIGQLLLSQKITSYELQRIGTDADGSMVATQRGPTVESSPRLLGRFRDGHLGRLGIDILSGEILSGEKLIDNPRFKQILLDRFPEAIGGEMEGAGVQAASGRSGVDWIIVKAVCDYAEHKSYRTQERQLAAAQNAARAVLAVVEQGGLSRQ